MSNTLIEIQRSHSTISYDILFKEHSKLIFKLIHNFIKAKNIRLNNTEVDDIYQEIALKIFKNDYLAKYNEEKSSFITWLNIICRTTTIDFYRKKMRWMEEILLDTSSLQAKGSIDSDIFSLPTEVLTVRQTEVITLFFKEGLIACEIATALGITARTVRSIKFQALERLRNHYETSAAKNAYRKTVETRRRAS
ncbi:MAG: sigma-70 family RNA polymerase sigma factor [Pseudodesulfovibrio sp.]|nr:sigma-70 family RNA polymerase sigma factor [Pseudodesulfovibrio sp.]